MILKKLKQQEIIDEKRQKKPHNCAVKNRDICS